MASDDKRVLRRCHIPACRVVWRRVPGAEQADDCLGRKVLGVSTAHAGRMARLALTSRKRHAIRTIQRLAATVNLPRWTDLGRQLGEWAQEV
jgi:hypothetical protein